MTPPVMPGTVVPERQCPCHHHGTAMPWPCDGLLLAWSCDGLPLARAHMAWPPAMLAHLLLLSMPGYCLEYLPEYLPGHTAAAKLRAPCCSGSSGIAAQAAQ